MTITKNDPNSEFWKAAEEASRRVEKFPPWKLGVLESKASGRVEPSAASSHQASAQTESKK